MVTAMEESTSLDEAHMESSGGQSPDMRTRERDDERQKVVICGYTASSSLRCLN